MRILAVIVFIIALLMGGFWTAIASLVVMGIIIALLGGFED